MVILPKSNGVTLFSLPEAIAMIWLCVVTAVEVRRLHPQPKWGELGYKDPIQPPQAKVWVCPRLCWHNYFVSCVNAQLERLYW